MTSVLLIDDDEELALLLQDYLEQDGFEVSYLSDGRRALQAIISCRAELVILDIMMPAINGIEVLRRIRRESEIPVLMLTARGDESDRISGLDLGADDYLAKPCSPGELAARIRAILRRAGTGGKTSPNTNTTANITTTGPLEIDHAHRRITWHGEVLEVTGAEFNLLDTLASHVGETVSRKVLSEHGLGRPLAPYDRAIDVHISSIRQKLGLLADGSSAILNIRGVGYQLVTG